MREVMLHEIGHALGLIAGHTIRNSDIMYWQHQYGNAYATEFTYEEIINLLWTYRRFA